MSEKIIASKKVWLRRYLNNRLKVDRLQRKVSIVDQKLLSIRSSNISGMPRGGKPITEADLIADKIEIEYRIQRLEDKGKEYRQEIINAIDNLNEYKYIDILYDWFINGYSAEVIAEKEGYTVRHIFCLYAEAVKKIEIPGFNNDMNIG